MNLHQKQSNLRRNEKIGLLKNPENITTMVVSASIFFIMPDFFITPDINIKLQ
jgi:hypothetical protein